MPYFILGLALAIGLVLIVRGLGQVDARTLMQLFRYLGIGAGLGVGGWIVLSGRYGLLLPLLPILVPVLIRARDRRNRDKAARGPSPGHTSTVETATLAMVLDHDSGRMEGLVRRGRFQGRRLDELSRQEVLALLADCRSGDPQAAALLEGWLDRTRGAGWREERPDGQGADRSRTEPAPATDGPMTRAQAFEVLGLPPEATVESIRDAHRRLMRKVHPDLGGSTDLAARINRARDILLGDR